MRVHTFMPASSSRAAAPLLLAVMAAALLAAGCAGSKPEIESVVAEPVAKQPPVAYNLGREVNSSSDDYGADFHDGRLIFTSKRPTIEGYIQGDDMWFSDRERGGWSAALNFGGTINSELDEGSAQITDDGGSVFYVQCFTDDGLGDADIYTSVFDRRGKWQSVRNLGEPVNTKYWDSQPFVSPGGDELYFSSDRPGGYGGTDLWVSKRLRSGKWGAPRNLGPVVNTSGNEKTPTIAPNGTLFFASDGHAGARGYDLYMSTESGKKGWTPPKRLMSPFNTSADDLFFRLSAEEDTVYISSNRDAGQGGLDIWLVTPNPYKDTTRYIYYFVGQVYDTTTTYGIKDAMLSIAGRDADTSNIRCDRSGRFRVVIRPGDVFTATASAQGYESATVRITIPDKLRYTDYTRSFGLAPLPAVAEEKEAEKSDAENPSVVLFDFDKSTLRSETRTLLDAVFKDLIAPVLAAKGDLEITLDAHTDDAGSEEYNVRLSKQRAAAVSSYLTGRGVPVSSISVNAYGESRPVDSNESDTGRQLNRRVEIRITGGTAQ